METELGLICAEGFTFFGKTSRLISHELKNVLAIIAETSGLLDELVELADSGMKLEPGKLRSLTESILEEVDRANDITRNMNAFAHSADEVVAEVDISQTVALMIKLSKYHSFSKKTRVRLAESGPHVIVTSPFFLGNLVCHAIDFAIGCADGEIGISFQPEPRGIRVTFSGLDIHRGGSFPTEQAELLAEVVSAGIDHDRAHGQLHLILPKTARNNLMHNFVSHSDK